MNMCMYFKMGDSRVWFFFISKGSSGEGEGDGPEENFDNCITCL